MVNRFTTRHASSRIFIDKGFARGGLSPARLRARQSRIAGVFDVEVRYLRCENVLPPKYIPFKYTDLERSYGVRKRDTHKQLQQMSKIRIHTLLDRTLPT